MAITAEIIYRFGGGDDEFFFDVVLGVIGGAAGAWVANRYLDRLFNCSRISSRRPRVH